MAVARAPMRLRLCRRPSTPWLSPCRFASSFSRLDPFAEKFKDVKRNDGGYSEDRVKGKTKGKKYKSKSKAQGSKQPELRDAFSMKFESVIRDGQGGDSKGRAKGDAKLNLDKQTGAKPRVPTRAVSTRKPSPSRNDPDGRHNFIKQKNAKIEGRARVNMTSILSINSNENLGDSVTGDPPNFTNHLSGILLKGKPNDGSKDNPHEKRTRLNLVSDTRRHSTNQPRSIFKDNSTNGRRDKPSERGKRLILNDNKAFYKPDGKLYTTQENIEFLLQNDIEHDNGLAELLPDPEIAALRPRFFTRPLFSPRHIMHPFHIQHLHPGENPLMPKIRADYALRKRDEPLWIWMMCPSSAPVMVRLTAQRRLKSAVYRALERLGYGRSGRGQGGLRSIVGTLLISIYEPVKAVNEPAAEFGEAVAMALHRRNLKEAGLEDSTARSD